MIYWIFWITIGQSIQLTTWCGRKMVLCVAMGKQHSDFQRHRHKDKHNMNTRHFKRIEIYWVCKTQIASFCHSVSAFQDTCHFHLCIRSRQKFLLFSSSYLFREIKQGRCYSRHTTETSSRNNWWEIAFNSNTRTIIMWSEKGICMAHLLMLGFFSFAWNKNS